MSEDITALLHTALADEPSSAIDPQAVLAAARGQRRRRRIATAATATVVAGLLVAVVGTVSAASPDPATRTHAGDAAAQPDARQPDPAAPAADQPTTTAGARADSLAGLAESTLHVRLGKVSTSAASVGGLDLDAGIASARDQTLFVYTNPAGRHGPSLSCRDFSGDGVNGDGYTGPCSVRTLPDGALMIVRSGTSLGRYTKTQAGIVHDGTVIFAEATNQRQVGHAIWKVDKSGTRVFRNAPVVSKQPPVTAEQLAKLVRAIDAQT